MKHAALVVGVLASGCGSVDRVAQEELSLEARDEMFQTLSGRLMEVIQSDGPAAAVNVCAGEAPGIAQAVGETHGVVIGRTSTQLRNPSNTAPDWAVSALADQPTEPTFVEINRRDLGALYPILLLKPCLACHGAEESLDQTVLDALATNYPDDQATGYAEGDLRGHFWVEVPPL
ncbi:MAG: DUF3365 domain-containing protein [Myxococcales bacterium]|nr:DUF3365 domain-containing protein [Myxococcales bacterium]